MKRSFKRRNYFIDKGVQGRFIVGFAAACMAGGIVAVLCFWYLAQRKIEGTLYSMRLPDVPMGSLFMEEMLLTMAISLFCVLLLFGYTARKVFIRIDGPLKKMAGAVRNIADGDLRSEVKLRESDEFQKFADEVNDMVGLMNSRFNAIRGHALEIAELSMEEEGADRIYERLKPHIEALEKEVKVFKV